MDFSCGYDCSEIRASTVYETLHALKAKENESHYSAFHDVANFASLMQSYEAFDPQSADPAQVRYLTAGFLFQVVDFYGEEREVAIVAMNYLDRFLRKCKPCGIENVSLVHVLLLRCSQSYSEKVF